MTKHTEAKDLWSRGLPTEAAVALQRSLGQADLVRVVDCLLTFVVEHRSSTDLIEELRAICQQPERWQDAKPFFERIRAVLLKSTATGTPETILYLLENTSKVVFNASLAPGTPGFDADSFGWALKIFRLWITQTGDPALAASAWNAIERALPH